MVWSFTPEQLQDPDKMVEYLKGKCCGDSKETQLTALCWALATICQTLLESRQHHPERESGPTGPAATQAPATGPAAAQAPATGPAATQTPATGTVAEPKDQPIPVSVTPIHKKKYTRKLVRLVKDDDEPGPSREQEEEPEPEVITRSLSLSELRDMRKDFSRLPGEHIITWLLHCWDNGASSLELEGREAKQLGSLSREGGIDKAIGKKAQALSLWRRLLSSVRESAPSLYANSLAVIDWKSEEAPTVDKVAGRLRQYEESLSSSLILAVEKLSQDVRQLKEDISYSPPVQTRIAAVRRKRSAPEWGYKAYTPRDILWFYLRDHGEDMRKWDGKPTSTLRARVHELQGKTAVQRDSSRKNAAPVSTGQPPRPSERPDRTYDPPEGTSKSFLQEVSSDYDEQD
ncbi:ubiquitin carboxyl-terminal hydrolase 4 [Grus japonensis]|uniref:Ubiquitin carboxyl-terminal hydrolase 4 n=1 Tax=Grus japonensis TaxID=30415 RepID=A0ABC9Y898_GRUJA